MGYFRIHRFELILFGIVATLGLRALSRTVGFATPKCRSSHMQRSAGDFFSSWLGVDSLSFHFLSSLSPFCECGSSGPSRSAVQCHFPQAKPSLQLNPLQLGCSFCCKPKSRFLKTCQPPVSRWQKNWSVGKGTLELLLLLYVNIPDPCSSSSLLLFVFDRLQVLPWR